MRQLNRDSGINLEEEEVLLEEPDNLEEIIEKINALFERIQSQNHESPFILLDFTSGTKVMSVGAVVSACIRGVENLTYVSGKREKGR